MQAETKQKMDASQVICEKCGELCDFKYDKCPVCGASLFGNEPQYGTKPDNNADKKDEHEQPKEDAKANEQKETDFSDSNNSKTSSETQAQDHFLAVILIILLALVLMAMIVILFIL